MKVNKNWSYHRYLPLNETERAKSPYVCRIAPFENGFSFDFKDEVVSGVSYALEYGKRDSEDKNVVPLYGFTYTVEGLQTDTDYAFCVVRSDGKRSTNRLVRTGASVGTVVNYLHPDDMEYSFSGRYLCSPSLLRLPNGDLLASMDVYAWEQPQNLTLIFISHDDGKTWSHHCELFPCFWGKMFLIKDKLYMLGCSTEYGDLLIGSSDDGGKTWGQPTVLGRGPCHNGFDGWHRAPMSVLVKDGRVMTDIQYGSWKSGFFCNAVFSAAEDSNLLDADSWVCSELLDVRKVLPPEYKAGLGIEGNVIFTPDGKIVDFLRYEWGKNLILSYDVANPEKSLDFYKIVDFPSTTSKCDIVYDEKSKEYYSIVSYLLYEPATKRNLLSLIKSKDLEHWELCRHLIDRRYDDPEKVGLQYVNFIIEGDDIVYLCRTAINGANTFHNSNYTTFHKIENFRE